MNPPTDLLPYLVREADRLGQLAAEGHLSIFVGAGVSVPLGLPAWAEFVTAMLGEAGRGQIPAHANEPTVLEGATRAKVALGECYWKVVGELLRVRHHALVASMRAPERDHESRPGARARNADPARRGS